MDEFLSEPLLVPQGKSSHPDTPAELLRVGTDMLAFDFVIFQEHEGLLNLGAA